MIHRANIFPPPRVITSSARSLEPDLSPSGPSADLNPIGYAVLRDTEVLPSPSNVTSVLAEPGSNVRQRKRRGWDVEPVLFSSQGFDLFQIGRNTRSIRVISYPLSTIRESVELKFLRSKSVKNYTISIRWGITHGLRKKRFQLQNFWPFRFIFMRER